MINNIKKLIKENNIKKLHKEIENEYMAKVRFLGLRGDKYLLITFGTDNKIRYGNGLAINLKTNKEERFIDAMQGSNGDDLKILYEKNIKKIETLYNNIGFLIKKIFKEIEMLQHRLSNILES